MTDSKKPETTTKAKKPLKLSLKKPVDGGGARRTTSTPTKSGEKLVVQVRRKGKVTETEKAPEAPKSEESINLPDAYIKSDQIARSRQDTKKLDDKKERPKEQDVTPSPEDIAAAQSEAPVEKGGADKAKAAAAAAKHPPKKLTLSEETKDDLAVKKRRDDYQRSRGKLTVVNALDIEHQEERQRSMAAIKRARDKAKRRPDGSDGEKEKIVRDVIVPEAITVQDLANRMAERVADVIKALMNMGSMATATQSIDADTAELIVEEFGHNIKRVTEADVENVLIEEEESEDSEKLQPRPPVVTVMGHVDHGKTSLLDAMRSTDVVAKEAGGITQHIGAYQITTESGDKITFIDTPGHAAFTAMRARGAKATDIVILVVAADDSIMPQTVEAIAHAKAAEVPIIVAINKMDKPEANPKKVRDQLLEHELVAEEYGGDIICVEVSATARTNLDKLVESVLLVAEMNEFKANPEKKGTGVVIEAQLEAGRGIAATLLVQGGTLKTGDIVVAGKAYGRVRALINDKGENVDEAPPAMPVEVLGLNELPAAGDVFNVTDNEKQAREIVEYRARKEKEVTGAQGALSIEQLFKNSGSGEVKQLPIIVKADVQGSVEAIQASLEKLSNDEVQVKILHGAAGGITESDIQLANTVGGLILGFNVRANAGAKRLAEDEGVDIRYFAVIYDLVDEVELIVNGMLQPTIREEFLGNVEVQQVFKVSKVGNIAGCIVRDGVVKRGAKVRIIRDGVVIHDGKLKTLKRFKDDVNEVKEGYECGIAFENYDDIREGDILEAYELVEEKRELAAG